MLGNVLFPCLDVARHFEIGDHECGNTCLGTTADTGGTFVADFTTNAGCSAGEGGDRGGVIVCLYFAKNVELARCFAVSLGCALLVDFPPVGGGARDDAAVVGVGRECAFWVQLVGVADHAEQREFALFAVDDPVGIENLVAAVLGVDLREHDELGVGRVALHLLVGFDQVVDFGGRHGEAPVDVGLVKGGWAFCHEWHGAQFGWLKMTKEVGHIVVNSFSHAVVQREHG